MAVGILGAEESGNVIARIIFDLLVPTDWAAQPQVNIRGYFRGRGMLPAERQQKEDFSGSLARQLPVQAITDCTGS